MVKRPKSPDTAEDEKYFTVYQPYPLNANWEIDDDYITFSRWIACCIGNAPLHALHYKPKARGMVLLEIDKKYPHNERLLGEHRWSEFLRNPSEEEKDRVTQIFHSLYTTGRAAQKDGWKRIHVEGSWFKDWSSDNLVVKYPYPGTHWCPTPPEDKTNKPLCRPLPVAVKPPPPPPVRFEKPVVGSATWMSTKEALRQNTPPALKGAWAAKQKPTPAAEPTLPAQPKTNVPISLARQSPPHVQSASYASPRFLPNAWAKPITQNTPVSPVPGATPTSAEVPAYPPGLGPRITTNAAIPPALVHSDGSGSSSSSGSGSSSETKSKLSWGDEPLETLADRLEKTVTISLSPSQDLALYGTPLDAEGSTAADVSPDLYTTILAPWEQSFKMEYNMIEPAVDTEDNTGNLWAEEEKISRKPVAPEIPECPVHKMICKKGICKEMSKIVRQMEKEKREKERGAQQGGNAKGRGGTRRRGNWRKNEGDAEGWSNEDASTNADGDGFSTVTGRGRSRANGTGSRNGNAWGKNRGQDVEVLQVAAVDATERVA